MVPLLFRPLKMGMNFVFGCDFFKNELEVVDNSLAHSSM